jgi:hypothetical protein
MILIAIAMQTATKAPTALIAQLIIIIIIIIAITTNLPLILNKTPQNAQRLTFKMTTLISIIITIKDLVPHKVSSFLLIFFLLSWMLRICYAVTCKGILPISNHPFHILLISHHAQPGISP